MELVFIGNDFYNKSRTMMSSIYQVTDGRLYRSDWGKVQIALANGDEVHIRQATAQELEWANSRLGEIVRSA